MKEFEIIYKDINEPIEKRKLHSINIYADDEEEAEYIMTQNKNKIVVSINEYV